VNYLLDTNACIALINGQPISVRNRLQKAISDSAEIFISSVALFELWYGVSESSREEFSRQRLETFLAGPVLVLPFVEEDARAAGSVRAVLEASGQLIGAYDLLIAGQALNRQLTLVTANVAGFSRIAGLAWQDWTKR
jgi:tRNA(fMet)-specific endonuclease VapC